MAPCRTTTLVPIFLLLTIILTVYMMSHESALVIPPVPKPAAANPPESESPPTPATHLTYHPLPSFFAQSLPSTNASTFDPLTSSLGLLPRTYPSDSSLPSSATPWERFTHYLMTLNADSPPTTSVYLLLLSRHGEGFHNVAESFFGTEKWDCFYAALDGSPKHTWVDADLTPRGIGQAEELKDGYAKLVREEGVLMPEVFYVSPLRRAVRTGVVTWGKMGKEPTFQVEENLREGVGIHTCDRRSTRSSLTAAFPDVSLSFEEPFPEDDPLWLPHLREPGPAQDIRSRAALDSIFTQERRMVISITSHGGTIASTLRVLGHRDYKLGTGGIMPVVVRVGKRGRSVLGESPGRRKLGGS
jgi:broad specificity phosphatase PhoE